MKERDLVQELKELIIEALSLEGVTPDDLDPEEPLFGEGLGLDSIDALEIAAALEERYSIDMNIQEDLKPAFRNISSLANLVRGMLKEKK